MHASPVSSSAPAPSRQLAWLAAATAVGGGLRFASALWLHPPAHFLFGEMLADVHRVYAFLDPKIPHGPVDALWPRGLTLLGALALRHFPDRSVEALAPLQAFLATLSIPLAFVGLRRYLGGRPALWAAWLLALDPLAIGFSSFFLPQGYAAFCLVAALALLRPDRPLASLLSGAALGAAALFCADALLLAPFWAAALLWTEGKTPGMRARRRASGIALALGALLVVVPEGLLLSGSVRRPVLLGTGAGLAFYASQCQVRPVGRFDPLTPPEPMEPDLPGSDDWPAVSVRAPPESQSTYLREGLRCLTASPWRAAGYGLHQLANALSGWPFATADAWPLATGDGLPWERAGNLAFAFLLVPLALLGLWRRRHDVDAWIVTGLPLAAVALTAVAFGGSPQRRAVFDPLLLGSAAWAALAGWEGRVGQRLRAFLAGPAASSLLTGKTDGARPAEPSSPWRTLAVAAVIAGLALATCWPLAHAWWFDSHEGDSYLLRLVEWVRSWKEGQLVPRWAPDFYGGYGAPHFNYFAPGVFFAAGPLALAGLSVDVALKLFIALAGLGGAAGAFLLVRGETRREDAALVAAVTFAFTPYRFVDLYMRGDLDEYAALCALPLVLWLYRELARCAPERRARTAALAAIAHASLLVFHTIIGQWATELLVVVAIASTLPAWERGDRGPARATALAMAGAGGLATFYLVPALLEKKLVHLELLTSGYYTAVDHLVPARLFFRLHYFDFTGDGIFRDPHAVRMPFTIGAPLVGAMVLAILCLPFRAARRRFAPGLFWWAGVLGLLFAMTPASELVWPALPFSSFMGFPWRLLALLATVGAAAIGVTWAAAVAPGWRGRWPLALAAAAAIAVDGARFVRIGAPMGRPSGALDGNYVQRTMSPGALSGEHLPQGATFVPTKVRDRLAAPVGPVDLLHTSQLAGERYQLTARARGASDIDLQVYSFPGWKLVPLSGPAAPELRASPVGLIRVHLPRAGQYAFELQFAHTPVRLASELASLLTLLLLWPVLRRLLRPEPAVQPEEGVIGLRSRAKPAA